MSPFRDLPLGTPIPDTLHAVSCSLPTMRAVRGYEEKDPEVVNQLAAGYPRFVVHPLTKTLVEHLKQTRHSADETLWLTSSEPMAKALLAWLGVGSGARTFHHDGIHGVSHREDPATFGKAKTFLQNIGGFVSSRQAEDALVRLNLLKPTPEESYPGDAEAAVKTILKGGLPGLADRDLVLAPSGMNAIYSAFHAVSALQKSRGRTLWVQLGWLYLDSIAILKKYTAPGDYVYVADPLDTAVLEALFSARGDKIAGVIAEVPTNPLIQTPELAKLFALCRSAGARLIVDPSVGSLFSVDAMPHCDLLVSSLTKYTASEGDVIAGVVAINPAGTDADLLRRSVHATVEPLYPRDLARLAHEARAVHSVLATIEKTCAVVAGFLETHPKIDRVFWAHQARSRRNYQAIARRPGSVGGMISFTLKDSMERFYDRLVLPKGPSFGMTTTLICPFMYLAHYDLVTTEAGRQELADNGLNPDLLRLCVGTEPAEAIIESLRAALG